MRYKWIFVLMVWIMNLGHAQDYAPIGAKWHYGVESIESTQTGPIGTFFPEVHEVVRDTMIQGKSCRIIQISSFFSDTLPLAYPFDIFIKKIKSSFYTMSHHSSLDCSMISG